MTDTNTDVQKQPDVIASIKEYTTNLEDNYVQTMLQYHNYEKQRDEGQKGMDLLRPRLDRLAAEMCGAESVRKMLPAPEPAKTLALTSDELAPRSTRPYKAPSLAPAPKPQD